MASFLHIVGNSGNPCLEAYTIQAKITSLSWCANPAVLAGHNVNKTPFSQASSLLFSCTVSVPDTSCYVVNTPKP